MGSKQDKYDSKYRWEYRVEKVYLHDGLRIGIHPQEVHNTVGYVPDGMGNLNISLEDALNILGQKGWELIGIQHLETSKDNFSADTYYIFKRPTEEGFHRMIDVSRRFEGVTK